ncbi:hypothetical protein B0H13DRAFT_1916804 [Mycena leptocephala]|nr:hypothetical protein B0H13DRAFT_1916804 [Mycena leptocephala]
MGVLRTKPMGTVKITHTRGRAYLYSDLKAIQVKIRTETPRAIISNAASYINLAHISSYIPKLPYLSMEPTFSVQSAVVHDCVVAIGRDRFLISAYYSPKAPVNEALKEFTPGFDWRGELMVVALGKKVPYLTRMKHNPTAAAINKFIGTFLIHIHMKLSFPVAIV